MAKNDNYIVQGFPPLQPLPNVSFGKLIYDKLVADLSEEEAVIDAITGKSISYKTLFEQTCLLANAFTKFGYGKNTMMAICSENCKEFYIPIIAAMYVGAVITPINYNYTKSEMVYTLNISKPRIVFCSKQFASKFFDLKNELKFIEKVMIIDSCDNQSITKFIKLYASEISNFTPVDLKPDHVGFILCSSGTTGLPKGVMVTHRNAVTAFMQMHDSRLFNQDPGLRMLGSLPCYHTLGFFRTLNYIYMRIKVIFLKKFEENLFLRTIEKYKITTLFVVPPLAIFLAKSPLVDKYDLSSLVEILCSAAPLSQNIEELLKYRLKVKHVQQTYGLTEGTLRIFGHFGIQKFGSCGKLVPYMSSKIQDPETGKSLGPNQIGELCVKGPLITKGYYNNDKATKNTYLSDGWLLTGDMAYYDDDKYFYIVDRIKEIIKYKGIQVAPAEVEALLLTHPNIKDAAIVGKPDKIAGELPLAFVVPNSNGLTTQEVKEFVAERVSSSKKLRGGVIFVSEIPKSASGKILRRKLKELLINHKSKL